jgi:hypothetical protein
MTPQPSTSDSSSDMLSLHRHLDLNGVMGSDIHSPSSSPAMPDLQPLKFAAAMMSIDPSTQLCRYEVAGGGVCHDDGCNDVHISRLQIGANGGMPEPNGA